MRISNAWMKHLEEVSEFKDLGLLVDSKLSWNIHEHSIVSKANKMLGLISRTCRGFADVKTFKTLHCSFFFILVRTWLCCMFAVLVKLKRVQVSNQPQTVLTAGSKGLPERFKTHWHTQKNIRLHMNKFFIFPRKAIVSAKTVTYFSKHSLSDTQVIRYISFPDCSQWLVMTNVMP